MWENGIQVVVNNRRNDMYDIFGGERIELSNLFLADNDTILLPIHFDLTDTEVERIINIVKRYDKK